MIVKPSNKVALVGRIQTWLDSPYSKENKLFPVSCTVKVLKAPEYSGDTSGYFDTIHYVTKALLGAAGVNVILDNFGYSNDEDSFQSCYDRWLENKYLSWGWYVPHDYPGFNPETADADYVNLEALTEFESQDYLVIPVADSMENDGSGKHSILDSWRLALELMTDYDGNLGDLTVVFDLSALRPEGTANGRGLVASGAMSFVAVYRAIAAFVSNPELTQFMKLLSTINEVIRRGGVFKNGAVTTSLIYSHPAVKQYLELPLADCPWLKKALTVDKDLPLSLAASVVDAVNDGSLWLEKVRYDSDGNRIYSNVCREVFLLDEDTCLLLHGNLGALEHPRQIVEMLVETMTTVCELHSQTGIDSSGIYKPSTESDQVGVGLIGLANFLAAQQVTYQELVEALEAGLDHFEQGAMVELLRLNSDRSRAAEIAKYFILGYSAASDIAINHGMRRAFVIAPTASAAYRYTDTCGYTCCPEISPPTYRYTKRNSDTNGSQMHDHGPVEEAEDLGADWHYRLFVVWQRLMNIKGLAHSSSFELWEPVDLPWVAQWLDGELWTTYYRRNIKRDHLDKSKAALGGIKPRKPKAAGVTVEGVKAAIDTLATPTEEQAAALAKLSPEQFKHYLDNGAKGVFNVSGGIESAFSNVELPRLSLHYTPEHLKTLSESLTNPGNPVKLDSQAETKEFFKPVSEFTASESKAINEAAKNQVVTDNLAKKANEVDKVVNNFIKEFRRSVDIQSSMLLGGSEILDADEAEELPEKFCLISDPDCTACAE